MNINATLFVQAFHFFIAYLILRFLLFKPSIKAIAHEHASHDALRLAIVHAKEKVEYQEEERQAAWNQCYGVCKEQQPELDYKEHLVFKGITTPLRLPTWDKKELDQLVNNTSQIIVKRLEQV